jgi:hypothetical protein
MGLLEFSVRFTSSFMKYFKGGSFMFENKTVEGIYYSRFIASWMKVTGKKIRWNDEFADWLSLVEINGRRLTEDEIIDIQDLATNGKLELETSIRNYLSVKR